MTLRAGERKRQRLERFYRRHSLGQIAHGTSGGRGLFSRVQRFERAQSGESLSSGLGERTFRDRGPVTERKRLQLRSFSRRGDDFVIGKDAESRVLQPRHSFQENDCAFDRQHDVVQVQASHLIQFGERVVTFE